VVDMNSTNGTYTSGSRVSGERRLDGTPDVRFGGVKLRFVPAGTEPDERTVRPSGERARPAAAATAATVATPAAGTSRLLWVLLALVVGAVILYLLRGHA
jgi:pSer/pThr/pTyr-binding forkhead associated (FHA) protein